MYILSYVWINTYNNYSSLELHQQAKQCILGCSLRFEIPRLRDCGDTCVSKCNWICVTVASVVLYAFII